jgi:hypothetical protein
MNTKSVTITVAVVGAIATLGAAFLSNMNKSKDQSPPPQQIASGAGAINVGRDAVINTNNIKSAGEEAAERVQACEAQHGMKIASDKAESVETAPASSGSPGKTIEHIAFRSCTWPRSAHADADGYLEIKVQSVDGPGESEASGTNVADRITAPCQQLTVVYQFGSQGAYEYEAPITMAADTIVTDDGKHWTNKNGALPFYPDLGEFVVLHNDHYEIASAKCP